MDTPLRDATRQARTRKFLMYLRFPVFSCTYQGRNEGAGKLLSSISIRELQMKRSAKFLSHLVLEIN
jgi:hypothetical protein